MYGVYKMIRLFIINGPDQKEYIIQRAIDISRYAFDEIVVLDKTHRYKNKHCTIIQVDNDISQHLVHKLAIDYSNNNEFLYIADADEILSKSLLDWIYKDEYRLIKEDTISVGGVHHYIQLNNLLEKPDPRLKYAFRGKIVFGKKNENLQIAYVGTHCGLLGKTPHYILSPDYYYLHLKHITEIAYASVDKVLWHPASHGVVDPGDISIIDEFKEYRGLHNDTLIYKYICKKKNKEEVTSFLKSIKSFQKDMDRDIDIYMNNDISQYDLDKCKDICCEHIRI